MPHLNRGGQAGPSDAPINVTDDLQESVETFRLCVVCGLDQVRPLNCLSFYCHHPSTTEGY